MIIGLTGTGSNGSSIATGKSTVAKMIAVMAIVDLKQLWTDHPNVDLDTIFQWSQDTWNADVDGINASQYIHRHLSNASIGGTWWKIRQHSDYLKKIIAKYAGLTKIELDSQDVKQRTDVTSLKTYREILQSVGHGMRDLVHPDFWVNCLYQKYDDSLHYQDWIVPDVRYPNEVRAIVSRDGIVFNVVNNRAQGAMHDGEKALDKVKPSLPVINNNGSLLDLVDEINRALKQAEVSLLGDCYLS